MIQVAHELRRSKLQFEDGLDLHAHIIILLHRLSRLVLELLLLLMHQLPEGQLRRVLEVDEDVFAEASTREGQLLMLLVLMHCQTQHVDVVVRRQVLSLVKVQVAARKHNEVALPWARGDGAVLAHACH